MNDLELLHEYAACRSEQAFAALVERYVNLVYSAAKRQVTSPQLAEEITQSVFLILAQKSASIRSGTILSGWLIRTTRYTAANALRREKSRQRYEEKAMATALYESSSDEAWERIAPLLDEALVRLSRKDRDALSLRFFEQKSFQEMAQALGTTDATAQKRVSRAIEKLRALLARRGTVVAASSLGAALGVHGVQAAPGGFSAAIVSAISSGAGIAGSVAALVQSTIKMLAWGRAKTLAIYGGALALVLVAPLGVANRVLRDLSNAPAGRLIQEVKAAPVAAQPVVTLAAAPQTLSNPLAFRVIETESGALVAGAKLILCQITEFPSRSTNYFETDQNGVGLLPRPEVEVKNWNYRVEIFRDGYVPKYVSWGPSTGDAFSEFPREYTAKVDRGVRISGVVVNEANQRIPGVRVVFSVGGSAPGSLQVRERLTMMGNYHTEMTDGNGVWSCTHVPQKFDMISFRLVNRDYMDITYRVNSPTSSQSIPDSDFLAGTARMEMKPGLIVSGVVTDPAGKPVAGAKITQDHDWPRVEASVLTGEDGQFQFRNVRPKELVLTVQCDGWASQQKTVDPKSGIERLHFELAHGSKLIGRVVDEHGTPIERATISGGRDELNRPNLQWSAKTDTDGRFVWTSAPSNPETYYVDATGYETAKVPLAADGTEQTITLRKSATRRNSANVIGTVIDAETRQPIDGFKVFFQKTQKTERPDGASFESITTPEPAGTIEPGKFRLHVSSYADSYVVEATADGYAPVRLTNLNVAGASPNLDFELKRATPLTGVVQSPDGKPIRGVEVILCTDSDHAYCEAAARITLRTFNASRAETTADGRFSLPLRSGAASVVFGHETGFASTDLATLRTSPVVTLQPWGRIEGTFNVGNNPGTNATMWLGGGIRKPGHPVHVMRQAKTDGAGHFVIEGIPPGNYRVAYRPALRDGKAGMMPMSHEVSVVVNAGETAAVSLGGTGRALVGRASAPGVNKPIDWRQDVHSLKLKNAGEPVAPKRENFASADDFNVAMKSFAELRERYFKTAEGLAASLNSTYVLIFQPDGTFRVDDVPSGVYKLQFVVTEEIEGNLSPGLNRREIARLETEVTVPEDRNETDSQPVDLGSFQLKTSEPPPAQRANR